MTKYSPVLFKAYPVLFVVIIKLWSSLNSNCILLNVIIELWSMTTAFKFVITVLTNCHRQLSSGKLWASQVQQRPCSHVRAIARPVHRWKNGQVLSLYM